MNGCGFLIPVYRHGSTLDFVVSSLEKFGLPVIVVDDGNPDEDKKFIRAVKEKFADVVLVESEKNCGKGAAVCKGILKAHELGLSHVFQLDSDGQHDVSRVEEFLSASKKNPSAIICGFPEYDESAPKARRNGRKIANAWIRIVTVSDRIKDAMIGFRIYPVEPFFALLQKKIFLDRRMGFDIDVLVRLSWRGIKIVSLPVKVFYPKDGVSNFRAVRDNVRISCTYARLCVGMILRLPLLIFRAVKNRGKND